MSDPSLTTTHRASCSFAFVADFVDPDDWEFPSFPVSTPNCFTLDVPAHAQNAGGSQNSVCDFSRLGQREYECDSSDGTVIMDSDARAIPPCSRHVSFHPWVECRIVDQSTSQDFVLPLESDAHFCLTSATLYNTGKHQLDHATHAIPNFVDWIDHTCFPWMTCFQADDDTDHDFPGIDHGENEEIEEGTSALEGPANDDYVTIVNWHDMRHALESQEPSIDNPLVLISFGIRGVSLGRKDGRINSVDPAHIQEVLWDLWQNSIPQFSLCQAWFVTPQPVAELGFNRAVIMIVEIKPVGFVLERHVTLRLTIAAWGPILQEPEAFYVPEVCYPEWMRQQHSWAQWCSPTGFRECSIELGGQQVTTVVPFPSFDGAFLKFCVADVPAQFARVRTWFPHGERVAQVAMQHHVRGILFFRLVFHFIDRPAVVLEVVYQMLAQPERLLTLLPADCHGRIFLIQQEPQEYRSDVTHRPTFHFNERSYIEDTRDDGDDVLSLMQSQAVSHDMPIPSPATDSDLTNYVVLQLRRTPTRIHAPSRDPFVRRTEFIHDFCTHQPGVWRWASASANVPQFSDHAVDVLIELPRPVNRVDIILNFFDRAVGQLIQ